MPYVIPMVVQQSRCAKGRRLGPAREDYTYYPTAPMDNGCLDSQLEDFLFRENLRIRRVIVELGLGEVRPTR